MQWTSRTPTELQTLAIARIMLVLFVMFSIVVLMAIKMLNDATMPILECAWHKKSPEQAFPMSSPLQDDIFGVSGNFVNSSQNSDISYLRDDFLDALLDQVCNVNIKKTAQVDFLLAAF